MFSMLCLAFLFRQNRLIGLLRFIGIQNQFLIFFPVTYSKKYVNKFKKNIAKKAKSCSIAHTKYALLYPLDAIQYKPQAT